jgi:hypothetical protein
VDLAVSDLWPVTRWAKRRHLGSDAHATRLADEVVVEIVALDRTFRWLCAGCMQVGSAGVGATRR